MAEQMIQAEDLPAGEYAIVEFFGHTTLVGRVQEVERFGSKMMAIEVLMKGTLLPPIFHGGASIYRMTPCSPIIALEHQHKEGWQLPPTVRATVPSGLLVQPPEPNDFTETDEHS
jgi:hypothetical protein